VTVGTAISPNSKRDCPGRKAIRWRDLTRAAIGPAQTLVTSDAAFREGGSARLKKTFAGDDAVPGA